MGRYRGVMLQDVPPPPAALPEVVVTAARLPPAAGEAAFSVVRVTPQALARARRLDEALTATPAVSLFRRTSSLAANPTTQGLSLRAIAPSGAGRALVTLDGVPLNDPFGGWVIWTQTPPEALAGADIVRGAGAGPWGAGALTGVVTLREREHGMVADASVSESGGRRMAYAGGVDLGSARLNLSAAHARSDGYIPVRGPAAGAADTPLDLEATGGAVRLDAPLGARTAGASLSLRASAYREDRGAGLAGARATATGHGFSAAVARAPTGPDAWGWRLLAWRRVSDLANSSVAVAADRTATTPANDQYETPATGWGLNAALRRVRPLSGGALEWEAGADVRVAEGETRERFRFMNGAFTRDRVAGGETGVAGAYVEGAWRGGPWLLAGGARLDGWENTSGRRIERDLATGAPVLNETDPDRSGRVASARLAARRDLGQAAGGRWSARAAAYAGFRPATLNELHRPFRVGNDLTEANTALEPERLNGIEAGLAFDSGRFQATAAVFHTTLDRAIVNVTVAEGPGTFPRAGFVPAGGVLRQRMNAGTIDATGLELAVTAQPTPALTFEAAISGTDARMDGGAHAPQLTGLRPAQAPIWSATAGATWTASTRLTLSGRMIYESRRFEDDLNSRVLNAGLSVDLRAEWRLTRSAVLWLAADNLADARIEVSETAGGVAGYGPPRTVSLGLRLTRSAGD